MELLIQLRETLMERLGINADELITFVDSGSVFFTEGDANQNINLEYQAKIYLVNYGEKPLTPIWHLKNWLKANQSGASGEKLQFSAEIIDHSKCDIEFTVPIKESIKAVPAEGGTELISEGWTPLELGDYGPTEWTLLLQHPNEPAIELTSWVEGDD